MLGILKKYAAIFIILACILAYDIGINHKSCETYINEDNRTNNMLISFFEEFPTDENLKKLKFVNFPTKLYIAAPSLKEFNKIKENINSKWVQDIIYWPILDEKDGYWLSPFSRREALLSVTAQAKSVDILGDAELPRRKSLILTQLPKFAGNKKIIEDFFKNSKNRIYSAEYFPEKGFLSSLLESLGLSFSPKEYSNYQVKMLYSSMHDFNKKFIRSQMSCGVKEFGENFIVGLGVLATGIKGDEPLISNYLLERDLMVAKESGINEVIIYRLGGLNKDYAGIIRKYAG